MNRPHAFSTFFFGFAGVLPAVLLTSVASAGQINAISLNFASGKNPVTDTFDMTPEMVAGVVRTDSWNNLHDLNGTEGNLMANANQSSNATVTWSSNGTWQINSIIPVDGDTTMMKSFLDARAPGGGFGKPTDATVTVADLPAEYIETGYDVYVYFDGATDTGAITSGYTIDNETFWINDTSTFDGSTYVLATSSDANNPTLGANYAKFSGLATSGFTLLADSDTFRAEVSGIQIVQVPEPSSLVLLLAGVAVIGLRRRRQ